MEKVTSSKANFIKLCKAGKWEPECIENGYMRLGYDEVGHELCIQNKWDDARKVFTWIKDQGTITRHLNQVKDFYNCSSDILWITFWGGKLWWGFADDKVIIEGEKRIRKMTNGWNDKDINGTTLFESLISGRITSVKGFRGAICNVRYKDELLECINSEEREEVKSIKNFKKEILNEIEKLIKNLGSKDFELLIDLIFRQAGYARTIRLGGSKKDIDIEAVSILNNERVIVQIKTETNFEQFKKYAERFGEYQDYDRFYFFYHTTQDKNLENIEQYSLPGAENSDIDIYNAKKVADLVYNLGLADWLTNIWL